MRLCCSTDRDHGSLKDAAGVVAASITTRRIIAPARESRAILTSPPVNCSRSILWAWPRLVFFDGFGSRRAAAVCLCCKSAQAMDKPQFCCGARPSDWLESCSRKTRFAPSSARGQTRDATRLSLSLGSSQKEGRRAPDPLHYIVLCTRPRPTGRGYSVRAAASAARHQSAPDARSATSRG